MLTRGTWATRLGFTLAAAGSAAGVGGVWRMPAVAGHGGGLLVVTVVGIAVVGIPLLWAQLSMGKLGQRDAVTCFAETARRETPWSLVGVVAVVAAFVALSHLGVMAGWSLAYVARATSGHLGASPDPAAAADVFARLRADGVEQIFWHLCEILVATAVVATGVRAGVERCSVLLLPLLLLLLLVLVGYAATLPGFAPALAALFAPHLQAVTPGAALAALGSGTAIVGLGVAAMLTYGSYVDPTVGVRRPAAWVAGLALAAGLLASVAVHGVVMSSAVVPAPGRDLLFVSLPAALAEFKAGGMTAALFYVTLAIAALLSAVALLESAVALFHDAVGWSRRRAAVILGGLAFVLGIPAALSPAWFSWVDVLCNDVALPAAAILVAFFVARVPNAVDLQAALDDGSSERLVHVWLGLLRTLVPLALLAASLYRLGLLSPG